MLDKGEKEQPVGPLRRGKSIIGHSDPEFVMLLPIAALILFGGTLLWPGRTFAGSAFVVFSELISEEFAGVIVILIGVLALVSLWRGNGFMRFMCMTMVFTHGFLAGLFVISGVNSTGNTYFVYAAGALWCFWRLQGR